MSKIVYSSSNMLNYTESHIKNCIDSMQKAIANSQDIIEPSSYEDMEYLKSLSSKIKEESDRLNKLNNWLDDNNSKYGIIVRDIVNNIKNIDIIVINKRIGYISHK